MESVLFLSSLGFLVYLMEITYVTGHFEFKSNFDSYFHLYCTLQIRDDLLKQVLSSQRSTHLKISVLEN